MERGMIYPRKNYFYTYITVFTLWAVLRYYNYASKRKFTTLNDIVMLVSRRYTDQVLTSVRL